MKQILLLSVFLFSSVAVRCQSGAADLYKILQVRDSLLFNIAFNTCDISQFDGLIDDDFEFYHDKGGINASKAEFVESVKNGLCKLSYKPRRELVRGTLQVFPLEKDGVLYGAIQMGRHRFYAKEKDKPEYFTSVAVFTHVWIKDGNNWKLRRGLSYDHQTTDASLGSKH